jgi:hypothetical protein
MSKYEPLAHFLKIQAKDHVLMSFAEVEKALGSKLPPSAYDYQAWWSNYAGGSHVQAKAWLDAGYETEQVDMTSQKLAFRRTGRPAPKASGMSDVSHKFKTAEADEKKPFRSPLWGALKGTFTIEPGWDLTKPALEPDELEDMYANLDRTADMIEHGLKGGHK